MVLSSGSSWAAAVGMVVRRQKRVGLKANALLSQMLHGFKTTLMQLSFMLKNLIAVRCFLQLQAVGNHERWIDLAILNMFEQWAQVPMDMRLSHLER